MVFSRTQTSGPGEGGDMKRKEIVRQGGVRFKPGEGAGGPAARCEEHGTGTGPGMVKTMRNLLLENLGTSRTSQEEIMIDPICFHLWDRTSRIIQNKKLQQHPKVSFSSFLLEEDSKKQPISFYFTPMFFGGLRT